MRKKDVIIFVLMSFVGVLIFFLPIIDGKVLLTIIINYLKNTFENISGYIIVVFLGELLFASVLNHFLDIPILKYRFTKASIYDTIIYGISFICTLLIILNVNLDFVKQPSIGGQVLPLAYSIFITILVSGIFVVIIIKSGIIEFFSELIEPFMQFLFKIPGHAAIDCLSSFVSSASVGVFLTDMFYKEKKYTVREARIVASCFSIMSIGFMVVLTTMADIEFLYSEVVVSSFIIMVILAIICVRIPPLSNKPDKYIDGELKKTQHDIEKTDLRQRCIVAFEAGIQKAGQIKFSDVLLYVLNAILFAQKVVAIMITPMILVMLIVTYTKIFDIIGMCIEPILRLFMLPNADKIAPSTIIGITEVSLPVISIMDLNIAIKSRFFVVILSIVQVIYFAESANAMLSSSIPFNVKELIQMFFIRTIIAIPLVVLAANLVT